MKPDHEERLDDLDMERDASEAPTEKETSADREAYEASRLLDAQMYAANKRENRRMAGIYAFRVPSCEHERVDGYGYCLECGEIMRRRQKQ
jgi:hypothetical protein